MAKKKDLTVYLSDLMSGSFMVAFNVMTQKHGAQNGELYIDPGGFLMAATTAVGQGAFGRFVVGPVNKMDGKGWGYMSPKVMEELTGVEATLFAYLDNSGLSDFAQQVWEKRSEDPRPMQVQAEVRIRKEPGVDVFNDKHQAFIRLDLVSEPVYYLLAEEPEKCVAMDPHDYNGLVQAAELEFGITKYDPSSMFKKALIAKQKAAQKPAQTLTTQATNAATTLLNKQPKDILNELQEEAEEPFELAGGTADMGFQNLLPDFEGEQ